MAALGTCVFQYFNGAQKHSPVELNGCECVGMCICFVHVLYQS